MGWKVRLFCNKGTPPIGTSYQFTCSPGFTETDMLPEEYRDYGASLSPFNRVGAPQDIAEVALFLASDAARWITGQNVQAGGGVV